jgi:DNA-binding transcriptional LysR family regulator
MKLPTTHLEQIRLRDVLLLDHLQETGSLRMTAQRLHVTQPAVTQSLQALERSFGVELVKRGGRGQRGVNLTTAGEAALVRMRVARAEMLAAHVAAHAPLVQRLRLGVLPLAMFDVVPKALLKLKKAMPQVSMELTESSVAGLWESFRSGQLDAIVSRLPSPSEGEPLPQGVVCRRVETSVDLLTFVCAQSHPAAALRRPSLAYLAQQDWALPPDTTLTRQLFDQLFIRASLRPPQASITSFLFHSNLQLAATGQWLTVSPLAAVRLYAKALALKAIRVEWGESNAGLFLIFRESALTNPAIAALQASFRFAIPLGSAAA